MAVELRRSRHKRNKDQNNNEEPLKKKSKKACESRELTIQEIANLNDEIDHLEEEIFQRESLCASEYTLGTLQRISSDLLENIQPCSSQENNKSEVEKDIDTLNNRLSSLEAFTGIRFVENSVLLLSKTDSRTVLLRRMSGSCHRISFTVEFEVQEDEQRKSTISSGQFALMLLRSCTPAVSRFLGYGYS